MTSSQPRILPARPLRLSSKFVFKNYLGAFASLLFGLGIAVGGGIWQLGHAQDILEQKRIWQTGIQSRGAEASGKVTTRRAIFKEYNLTVRYVVQGRIRTGKVEFDTLAVGADTKADPIVRYDPRRPQKFALSWAVDVTGARWVSFGVFFSFLVGIGGVFVWLFVSTLRRVSDARACAAESDEVWLTITGVTRDQYGNTTFKFRYTAAGESTPRDGQSVVGAKMGAPLYRDEQTLAEVLGLVSARRPARPWLLSADLYPFDVPPGEREATLARLRQHRAAA
jgi:hypothetical protein